MTMSKHAQIRIRQRGFSMDALDVIWKFGRESYAPGGAVKYFFGKKEHRHASSAFQERLQAMERAKGGNIVVIDETIITAYKN